MKLNLRLSGSRSSCSRKLMRIKVMGDQYFKTILLQENVILNVRYRGDKSSGILNNRFHLVTRTIYLFLVLKVIKENCNMESLSALQTICIVYKLKNLKIYKGPNRVVSKILVKTFRTITVF